MAKKVKKLGVEKLMSVDDTKNLSELKAGKIVLVTAAELRPAEHGNMAIFTCIEVAADGKREPLRLMIPSRFYSDGVKFTCVMAYLGTKNEKPPKRLSRWTAMNSKKTKHLRMTKRCTRELWSSAD